MNTLIKPRLLVDGEIPIFLTHVNTSAVHADGTPVGSIPHVSVQLGEGSTHHPDGRVDRYISSYAVVATDGQRTIMRHGVCEHARTQQEIDNLLDSLKEVIATAVDNCREMKAIFDDAARRTSVLNETLPMCSTREGYEQACKIAGQEPLPDEEILKSYGIAYGVFSFPEYPPETIIRMRLAARRLHHLQSEQHTAKSLPQVHEQVAVSRGGQLWEPCERCGQEPVYMPLHLCDACWPN